MTASSNAQGIQVGGRQGRQVVFSMLEQTVVGVELQVQGLAVQGLTGAVQEARLEVHPELQGLAVGP